MEINVYATLRPIVGGTSVTLDDVAEITVEDMLSRLCAKYPDLQPELYKGRDDLHPAIHILVNGRDMRYIDGQQTVLRSTDVVRIFPPVGGGAL
ncbi:MAG: MoaD/ThiS family protein [Anaerolineae bacterium]|nr:MoaD/ThiS family protein [Anaerolineae bacterium]